LASLVSFAGFCNSGYSEVKSGHQFCPQSTTNSETGDAQHGRLPGSWPTVCHKVDNSVTYGEHAQQWNGWSTRGGSRRHRWPFWL